MSEGFMSIHVVDLVRGGPAIGMKVTVQRQSGQVWDHIKSIECRGNDERTEPLVDEFSPGAYRLLLHVADYYATYMEPVLDPPYLTTTEVGVNCGGDENHHHVALAVTPTSLLSLRGN